jgi:hypothetical protein
VLALDLCNSKRQTRSSRSAIGPTTEFPSCRAIITHGQRAPSWDLSGFPCAPPCLSSRVSQP